MGRHPRVIKAVCIAGAVVGVTLLGATATTAQEASVTVDIESLASPMPATRITSIRTPDDG